MKVIQFYLLALIACATLATTFYQKRFQLDQIWPFFDRLVIHEKEVFNVYLQNHFQSPFLSLNFDYNKKDELKEDHFNFIDTVEWTASLKLNRQQDWGALSTLYLKDYQESYLYHLKRTNQLKIADFSNYYKLTRSVDFSHNQIQIPLSPNVECDQVKHSPSLQILTYLCHEPYVTNIQQYYAVKCGLHNPQIPSCEKITLLQINKDLESIKLVHPFIYIRIFKQCKIQVYFLHDNDQFLLHDFAQGEFTVQQQCLLQSANLVYTLSQTTILVANRPGQLYLLKVQSKRADLTMKQILTNSQYFYRPIHQYLQLTYATALDSFNKLSQIITFPDYETNKVIVKGYEDDSLYFIDFQKIQNPYLQRRYFNFEQNTSDYQNLPNGSFNDQWIINQVSNAKTSSSDWVLYRITANDKLMPFYSFDNKQSIVWIEFFRFSQDFILIRNYEMYQIGKIRGKIFEFRSISGEDTGKQVEVKGQVTGGKAPAVPFNFRVFFVSNSERKALIFKSRQSDKVFQSYRSTLPVKNFIAGNNIRLETQSSEKFGDFGIQQFVVEIEILNKEHTSLKDCQKIQSWKLYNPYEKDYYFHTACIINEELVYFKENMRTKETVTRRVSCPLMKAVQINLFLDINLLFVLFISEEQGIYQMKIFQIQEILIYIDSYEMNFTPRLLNYLYLSPTTQIIVFVDQSQKVLRFNRIILDKCCKIQEESLILVELKHRMRNIFFINSDDGFIFYHTQCLVSALHLNNIESQIIYWVQLVSEQCYERGYVIHEGRHSKFILIDSHKNYVTEYYINVPFIPVFHAQIPLFYPHLQILRSFKEHEFSMPYHNGYFLILKDPQGFAILAKFELTYSLQQSLHFAVYLESNRRRIMTDQLVNSEYCYLLTFNKQVDTFLIYTDQIVIKIKLRDNRYIAIQPKGATEQSPYSLKVNLAKDPITNQEIQVLSFSQSFSRNITLNLQIQKSGLVAQRVSPKESIYVTQGDFRISFNELFSGNYLSFNMTCEPAIYCGDENAPLYYPMPYQIYRYALSTALSLKFVFKWRDRLVSVDTNSNLRIFQHFSDGFQPIEINKEMIGRITDVHFAHSFHDPTFMSDNMSIWLLQATNEEKSARVNINLVVTKQEDQMPTFREVQREPADLPLVSAKYSHAWHSIFVIYQLENSDENKLVSFTYDFAAQKFIPKRKVILDSFRVKVSPFQITAYQIHDQVPIVIIALKDYGIMAYNIFTTDLVMVLDFKRYFQEQGYIKFIYNQEFYISAIFILSNKNIGFLISGIGVQLIRFTYHFSLDTVVYPIFLINNDMDPFSNYLYSPYRLSYQSNRALNWVQVNYDDFFLHLEYQDNFFIHYYAKNLKAYYLNQNIVQNTWEIVVFNYFNNKYSKEYLRFPLKKASLCYWIGVGSESISSDNFVKLFTFCLNSQNESFLYEIDLSLSPAAYFSVDRMYQYHNISEVKIKIEGQTYLSNITAESIVVLKVNLIEPSYAGVLTAIGIIVGVVLIFFLIEYLFDVILTKKRLKQQTLESFQTFSIEGSERYHIMKSKLNVTEVELTDLGLN